MPAATPACLSPQQMRPLCDAPDPQTLLGLRDRAFLATLASSGCSLGEMVALKMAQIGHSLPLYITIPQGKLLLARQAPLSREAHARIAAWLAQRPVHSAYVFTRFDGRGLQARVSAQPLSRTSAWRLVQRYGRQAGLEHIKPQDFRRFVGCELTRRHGIRQAQLALGHKRIETTAQQCVAEALEGGLTDGFY